MPIAIEPRQTGIAVKRRHRLDPNDFPFDTGKGVGGLPWAAADQLQRQRRTKSRAGPCGGMSSLRDQGAPQNPKTPKL